MSEVVMKTPLEWARERDMILLSFSDWSAQGFPVDKPCTESDFEKTWPWCTVER